MKQRLRLLLLRLIGLLLRRVAPAAAALPADNPRILLIRPDHLGDVLLSRPAIDALAATLPHARITVAVGTWGRPALGEQAGYRTLLCPFPGFARARRNPLRPYILLLQYAALLRRRERHDMAVLLRPDHWWGALLAALAGIPIRIGYHTAETAPFLTAALPPMPDRHVAEQSFALVRAAARCAGRDLRPIASALPASATGADRQRIAALLADAGIPGDRAIVILHPGAGSPLKAWPLERFAAVGTELARALGASLAITGSADERPIAQRLCAMLPHGALNLAGMLSWGELEALLARATLVIGVDSGPLHLAVAAGTPSVALFGPADPAHFAPWGPPARHRVAVADLPCRPCRRLDYCALEPEGRGPPPCMRHITVHLVIDAALAALNQDGAVHAASNQEPPALRAGSASVEETPPLRPGSTPHPETPDFSPGSASCLA